jgi:hypothetical protein
MGPVRVRESAIQLIPCPSLPHGAMIISPPPQLHTVTLRPAPSDTVMIQPL